jgi:Ser/Thr protein kinase RdoA (MazF antagonist)
VVIDERAGLEQEADQLHVLSERKQVHRSGGMMVRPWAPWTATVHALLRHLEAVGFTGSPRVIGPGANPIGLETLQFVAGDVASDRVWDDDGIYELGRLLRALHVATSSFRLPPQAIWQESFLRADDSGAIISHGDAAPWNVVARQGRPVALIDWELAGPVDRLNELAHTVWLNARLFDEGVDDVAELPSAEHRIQQLRLFADGYELPAEDRAKLTRRLIDVAILSAASDAIEARITPTSTGASWLAWGIAWRARSAAWLVRHRRPLERALR